MNNAIVVMFDSLSYRYLACYGNDWIKTPNFDRIAREGVLFENCFIEGLPTIPCRRSMHTGRFFIQSKGWSPLDMEDTTIADLCWGRPIDTALIFDCPMYRLPKFGYTRGFDKVWFTHGHGGAEDFYAQEPLLHLDVKDYIPQHIFDSADQRMGEKVLEHTVNTIEKTLKQRQNWRSSDDRFVAKTMKQAMNYLSQVDRNKQFFLWVDCFDPHEPWDAPSVWEKAWDPNAKSMYNPTYTGVDNFSPIMGPAFLYSEEELNHVRMLYAELVTLCDTWLGHFIDHMRKLGLEENTLLMIVSDHGEPMGNAEHGHGIMCKCRPWPYDELVHAPMLLRAPTIKAGQRIPAFVQSSDVAPTICDWLGIGVHPDMQGKSLLPLCRGEVTKVRDYAVAGYYNYSWAIYTPEWSYIHWLKEENNTYSGYMSEMAGAALKKSSEHLSKMGVKGMMDHVEEQAIASGDQIDNNYVLDNHSLDGADMWTCGHNSKAEVPERDELYNSKTDPYQLKNVISENTDIATELLKELRFRISELKAS